MLVRTKHGCVDRTLDCLRESDSSKDHFPKDGSSQKCEHQGVRGFQAPSTESIMISVCRFFLSLIKSLCPSAATKLLSIISLKHAPKKMMQINQSRRSTHALETRTQCFQMQCPLAIRSSVAKEMVTRHRCLESSRISGGVVLDSLLIPFGLTS